MPLTQDREVLFFSSQELLDLPMDDNVVIHKGALVGRNRSTGYVRPLVAGDDFVGVAYRQADNTQAGHSAGAVDVRVYQSIDIVHAVAGLTQADLGREVFASDDETLTLSPAGNSRVGRVVAIEEGELARVRCQPVGSRTGLSGGLPTLQLADANATLTLDQVNRVLVMANTASRTLTLPPVANVRAGGWLRVIKTSSDAFPIILDANGSETIDGVSALVTIDGQYDTALLLCTGSEWVVLSRDIS